MKLHIRVALGTLFLIPASAFAQSPIDAYNLSQTELRGTARFMAMGGAFTALGGDLSSLNQNPAGIGIYRGSDTGLTFDINMLGGKVAGGSSWNHTHFDVNNFGYVGTYNFNSQSVMQTFSWGFAYNRLKSFARQYRGGGMNLNTSMSNYVAAITNGIDPYDMMFDNSYNPYRDSDIDWLSILGYSSGIINAIPDYANGGLENLYTGLFQYGNLGSQSKPAYCNGAVDGFEVRERGYIDEYTINFGGNLSNMVYWGLGLGIQDLSFDQTTYYAEYLKNAAIPASDIPEDGTVTGDCDWELNNVKKITGTGFNVKFGLIFKPVNELRIGAAIHTPTWYSLTTSYYGNVKFGADNGFFASEYTDDAYFEWNLKSPWKFMIGAAGVIGGRGIISLDYQHDAYGSMTTSDAYGPFDLYNEDIQTYFKATNTLRLGAEYRVTPQFSVRAGYSFSSTAAKAETADGAVEVVTAGTDPSYTLLNNTNTISAGIGYRTGGFYFDLAYLHRATDATYHAFTNFKDINNVWTEAPTAKVDFNSNQLVFTLGYKF